MAVEIVFTTNWRNRNPADGPKVWIKGYPVDMKDTPCVWGGRVTLPRFVIARVTDANLGDIQSMISSNFGERSLTQEWRNNLDWSVVNYVSTLDGYRLNLFTTNPGLTNKAAVTRNQVEIFLNRWNANVVSFTTNSVTFDVGVYNAIISEGFWDIINVGQVIFNETNYDESIHTHRVTADYSALDIKPLLLRQLAVRRRADIISNVDQIVTMDITRNDVVAVFKRDVKIKVEKNIYKRQFRISESTVDNIISQGGVIEATLAQANPEGTQTRRTMTTQQAKEQKL